MRPRAIVLACFALHFGVAAQESAPADSSAGGPSLLRTLSARAIADADSNSAVFPDSLVESFAPRGGFLGWLDSWQRTLGFNWSSNVGQYSGSANFDADLQLMDGNLKTSWDRTETEFRQQDRSSRQSNFLSTWNGGIAEFAALNVSMTRTSLDDETRFENADAARITNEVDNVNVGMDGAGELSDQLLFRWAANGKAKQDRATNRGTELSSSLAGAAASARWIYDPGRFTRVTARFGYERLGGQRTLRVREDDATTVQDTVGTRADIWLGRLTLGVGFDRVGFSDDRLDWRRNSFGAVDTLQYSVPARQFGREQERRYLDKFNVTGDMQILPNLDYRGQLSRSRQEQSYLLSRQGFLVSDRAEWSNELTLEYLPESTLKLEYSIESDWNDQRSLDDDRFRGRETRRKQDLRVSVRQPVFAASTLVVTGQQYLEQLIYESAQNTADRDRFSERVDATLESEPFRKLSLNMSGIIARQDEINIRAERVGNNREERTFEVRGGYAWKPTERFSFDQLYRQQILFRDYHLSDDRDEFNKQGQFNTKIKYLPMPARRQDPSAGGATSGRSKSPTIELSHSLQFRQNGKRARPDLPLDRSYSTTQRRFDHTFSGSVSLPISIWTFSVLGDRGYQTNETRGGTVRQTEEDGKLEMAVSGDKSFRLGLVSVSVDFRRILAFGRNLREEARDYWMANSSLTVRF